MRVRELALAGAFALSAAIPVHADPPGSKMRTPGPVSGILISPSLSRAR